MNDGRPTGAAGTHPRGGAGTSPAGPSHPAANHEACTWEQAGPCVWCTDHGVRLYQGELPDRKRTVPKCAPSDHDWDPETGMGFYSQCRTCKHIEWSS